MNCSECGSALVNGACPNTANHASERMVAALTGLGETIRASVVEAGQAQVAELRALIDERLPATPPPTEPAPRNSLLLPGGGGRGLDPADTMRDPWTAEGYTRSDFELALQIAEAGRRLSKGPVELNYSDQFKAAARWHIFEDPKTPRPQVVISDGERGFKTRAMDSQETGYGLELIGVEYANSLWQAARNLDTLVGDIRVIPMATSSMKVPIDGNVPEMVLASENTSAGNTLPTTQKTPSNRATLTAVKFAIYQTWSAELEEDSVIAFVPFLRDMLAMSAAVHLGSAYLNGDTTDAGTGNINLDDANPADTKHYLAWDGIRHDWLVTTTGQGKNMAAAIDPKEINVARGKLNGGDDDVDNAITNINWGLNPRNLRAIMDWDTYMALLDTDKVTTVDKYGPGATILTGELGSIYGIPIIIPPYASKTEADGKASTTEASNTKGQITVFAPAAYLGGNRRGLQFFMDRIQGRDQFLIELYTRRAFTRFGTNGAAGIYNITL